MRASAMNDEQVSRLQRALDEITEHPERHDQASWFSLVEHDDMPRLAREMEWLDGNTGAPDEGGDLYGRRLSATDYLDVNGAVEWHCGTAGCLAGHVVLGDPEIARGLTILLTEEGDAEYAIDVHGERFAFSTKARELLGLSMFQAETMFAGSRSIVALWALAEIVSGGRVVMPVEKIVDRLRDPYDGTPFTTKSVDRERARFGRDVRLLPHPREVVWTGPDAE